MELYYKDLISKEASLDKLVDDLMLVVQGAQEIADAAGVKLPPHRQQEFATRLERLKEGCRRLKQQAADKAHAADKAVRDHPYATAGIAFAAGLLLGVLINRGKSE